MQGEENITMNKAKIAASAMILAIASGSAAAEELKVGTTGAALVLFQRLGEAFNATKTGDTVEVIAGLGSSGAIAAVEDGALQLAVSGRALNSQEQAKELESAPLLETPFIFVSSHPQRQKLSRSDIVAVFNGTLSKWPDGQSIKPILRPRSESTTLFLIQQFAGMQAAMEKLRQRADIPIAATDQDNIEAAQGMTNSFAATTLLQFRTETPRLRAIEFDGVEPTVGSMEDGSYPLKVALLTVTKKYSAPATQRFLAFLRSPEALNIMRNSGAVPVHSKQAAMK
jgi:phosphate transport system substrate-binding protein